MAVSWRLAGMLNSYLSIPFHFSLEISVDGLLVLLVYEGYCPCDNAFVLTFICCVSSVYTYLMTSFVIFLICLFFCTQKCESCPNSITTDSACLLVPLQRQLDPCCSSTLLMECLCRSVRDTCRS